eukprot:SAG11_NODE_775_length_7226_cov_2.988214_7_plen_38_part_00
MLKQLLIVAGSQGPRDDGESLVVGNADVRTVQVSVNR